MLFLIACKTMKYKIHCLYLGSKHKLKVDMGFADNSQSYESGRQLLLT